MQAYLRSINDHYGQTDLADTILIALERAGKDLGALTREDMAPFDEFHMRGREATRELARLAVLHEGIRLLDIGCGVGGPARTLAAEFGCVVTGLDLVEEYCRTAELLTARVGLNHRVAFRRGDVTAMPFGDATFDAVWSQHTILNVQDKAHLFREVRRVLRPAGRLALYEVCAGSASPVYLPVPWAGDTSINFLVPAGALRPLLTQAGFGQRLWADVTGPCLEWFRRTVAAMGSPPENAAPPIGLNLLMGGSARQKAANVVRNLEEDRIRVVLGVYQVQG